MHFLLYLVIAFSLSTSLKDYVVQPLDHAQGPRLSGSEKGKSSSVLLFERRMHESKVFACPERNPVRNAGY